MGLVRYRAALTESQRREPQDNRLLGELKQPIRKLFCDFVDSTA